MKRTEYKNTTQVRCRRSVRSINPLGAALAASISVFACQGNIKMAGGAKDQMPDDGIVTGGAADTTPSTTMIRRLTRTEYNNTIRDLLFDPTRPGSILDEDGSYGGFDNNAEMLRSNLPPVEKYDEAAAKAVDNAFTAGSAARTKILAWGKCGTQVTDACAREVISTFARHAWRRPVESSEVDALMGALAVAKQQGEGAEAGVKLAFRMGLVSPHFLYRVELDPVGSTALHPVTPHELATRLSYFIWSSMPDPELAARADDGTLSQPEVFAAQLKRMLADDKADAFVDNFAGQWLSSRELASATPDPEAFPKFDVPLREALAAEPLSFFREFLTSDKPITDMLEADFTFVNERLAQHYGLAPVTGKALMKVPSAGTHRGGILSLGAMLTTTSLANRTDIPRRGQWVLDRLLCTATPPPPADIPPLDTSGAGLPLNATPRDFLAKHRKDPACMGCHVTMDGIGFAMEYYDPVGAWQDAYSYAQIDARGELPGGITFNGVEGPNGLAQALKKEPRFTRCVTKTMFGYALGREAKTEGDYNSVVAMTAELAKPEHKNRLLDLVTLVTTSSAFQTRGGQP